jgi:hypothetical protein
MAVNTSNYTGRVHRTLQSAFGPYTDNRLYEKDEQTPWRRGDLVIVAIAIVTLALLFAGVI